MKKLFLSYCFVLLRVFFEQKQKHIHLINIIHCTLFCYNDKSAVISNIAILCGTSHRSLRESLSYACMLIVLDVVDDVLVMMMHTCYFIYCQCQFFFINNPATVYEMLST